MGIMDFLKVVGDAVADGAKQLAVGTIGIKAILDAPERGGVKMLLRMEVSQGEGGFGDQFENILSTLRTFGGSDETTRRKAHEVARRFDGAKREFQALLDAIAKGETEADLRFRLKSLRRRNMESFHDIAEAIYANAENKNGEISRPARQLADYVDEELAKFDRQG